MTNTHTETISLNDEEKELIIECLEKFMHGPTGLRGIVGSDLLERLTGKMRLPGGGYTEWPIGGTMGGRK